VWPASTDPCFHLAAVEVPGGALERKQAYEALLQEGIHTQVHYIPVYWHPYYREKYGYETGKCPNAEAYYSRCLSLPLYESLSDGEVRYVIETLASFLRKR
jgi:dTDP-4-amino-4,6-dideoxygalactose transaminase